MKKMKLYKIRGKRANKRQLKRERARKRVHVPVRAKLGVRPVSTFHPLHPARLYGWDDKRTTNRDRMCWQ